MIKARSRRLSSIVLALALWLGIGVTAPLLVHLTSSTLPFRDAVVAAQSDTYALVRPVELGGASIVRVERGTVLLTDGNGKPVANSAAASMLAGGTGTLVLDQAAIHVSSAVPQGIDDGPLPVAPLVDALAKLRAETIILRRSSIGVVLPSGQTETLHGVDATVSLKRKGQVTVRGKGTLRGHHATFDLTSGLQVERKPGAPETFPLRAQIRTPHLEINFDGRVAPAAQMQLDGQSDLTLSSVRQVARWLGAYWPQGPGLNVVSVRGHLAWTGRGLVFDRATTRVDGSEATGAVELSLSQPRPMLGGTFAFGTLDLSPFLRDEKVAATRSWASMLDGLFSVPLGGLLDADLRVSAERVLLEGNNLGSSAATLALKDGKLLADIAELQVGSGRGAMQVRADLTAFKPKLSLRGKLDNVDLGRLLNVTDKRPLLQAPGSVVLDLTASGTTEQELLRTVSGRVTVRTLEAGRIGLDLRRGLAVAAENDQQGWAVLTRGTTAFETAELKLIARDGVLFTEAVEARTSDGLWAATGLINIAAGRLDLRLTQVPLAQRSASQPSVLEIRGPWNQPTIKAIADPGNASVPVDPAGEQPARTGTATRG